MSGAGNAPKAGTVPVAILVDRTAPAQAVNRGATAGVPGGGMVDDTFLRAMRVNQTIDLGLRPEARDPRLVRLERWLNGRSPATNHDPRGTPRPYRDLRVHRIDDDKPNPWYHGRR